MNHLPIAILKYILEKGELQLARKERESRFFSVLFQTLEDLLRTMQLGKLSGSISSIQEVQIVDGRLEYLYHGWQFKGEGKCVDIPQELSSYLRCKEVLHQKLKEEIPKHGLENDGDQ